MLLQFKDGNILCYLIVKKDPHVIQKKMILRTQQRSFKSVIEPSEPAIKKGCSDPSLLSNYCRTSQLKNVSFYAPTQKNKLKSFAELRIQQKNVNEKLVVVKASYHTFSKFLIVRVMASWLRHWIPNPVVLGSEPRGGSKVDSFFHHSKVDEMSTRNFWRLSCKK